MSPTHIEEDDYVETPADEEISFFLVYLDHEGNTRHATLRSSHPGHEVRASAPSHRAGLKAYCAALGGILVSVQVTYERNQNLVGQRPRLRLVADNTNGTDADRVRPQLSMYSAPVLICLGQVGDLVRLCF